MVFVDGYRSRRDDVGFWRFSGTVKKVVGINQSLLGTMECGTADYRVLERDLGHRCKLYGKFLLSA